MSRFAIRPEYSAVNATRFVAIDESDIEGVYRIGNNYFPASVFEALFEPVPARHENPSGAFVVPGGVTQTNSVGAGSVVPADEADSRRDGIDEKTETGDAPPNHAEDQEEDAPPDSPQEFSITELRERIMRALDRPTAIPRDALEEWALIGIDDATAGLLKPKLRAQIKWLEERGKVTRVAAPPGSKALWLYWDTARMTE
jgi:hypothetical protein